MARNYGRFTTSIYRDDDFRALTLAQQGAYYLLGLQPDITAAGLLTLALGRWASKAQDCTRSYLTDELRVLQQRGHIAIDDATEELLIVKFIKWDGGWCNSKRLPVVMEAVSAIESVDIRGIAVDELRKLAVSDATSSTEIAARDALCHALSAFDRVVVTEGDYNPAPETQSLEGEPLASEPPRSMFCDKHPNGTTDPCGPCGTARRIFDAWHDADAKAQAAAVDAERRRRRDCTNCNPQGRIEGPEGQDLGRCTHEGELVPAGAAS